MNVIFLSQYFHPHIGGVEKHVEEIALELIKLKHKVTVITVQYESSLTLEEKYKQIQIYRIPKDTAKSKIETWKWISDKKDLFRHADLVHAHDVFWWYLPLRFKLKLPVYTTFHGWEGKYPPTIKAKIWRKMAEKLSKGNICIGTFITRWYGTKPNFVSYGATRQELLPAGDKNKLLIIGRLSKDNDLPLVLEALTNIKQDLPDLKTTFLGDGELAWEAEKIGKVLGFKDNPETYLIQTKWVIASSYLAILDAIAAGRTVFSVYSNPLKQDYLQSHPLKDSFYIANSSHQLYQMFLEAFSKTQDHSQAVPISQAWAANQKWEKLAQHYIKLWSDTSYKIAYNQWENESY